MTLNHDTNWGAPELLPQRLAYWVERIKFDKALPWAGLGLLADLEAVMRLLSLQEFADWLRVHPDPDLQQWARAVQTAADERDSICEAIDTSLPDVAGDYEGDVEAAGKFMTDVRGVLVECGALAADDTATDVPGLLRALLA